MLVGLRHARGPRRVALTGRPAARLLHHAENSDHRDCAAAEARHRAAIPATTATETPRPMVSRGLTGRRAAYWQLATILQFSNGERLNNATSRNCTNLPHSWYAEG